MIPNPCSNILESGVDFFGRRDAAPLQGRCGTEFFLGCKVAFNHPTDGAFPLWMRGTKNFVKHVQIDAETLHIVFN